MSTHVHQSMESITITCGLYLSLLHMFLKHFPSTAIREDDLEHIVEMYTTTYCITLFFLFIILEKYTFKYNTQRRLGDKIIQKSVRT